MSEHLRPHPQYPDKLWIRGPLSIPQDVLADLDAHALQAYPDECCGFVFGPAATPHRLTSSARETNEANRYHALDPETFPRTARTYFKINELRAVRTIERAEAQGLPLKVVYHSHCDAGAYFSDEDIATFSRDGQLMWPCAFIVVSVIDGKISERKLWVHIPEQDAFEEAALEIT